MAINRRDIIQILRDENELLKLRNKQVSGKLARQQQAFRVLADIDRQTRAMSDQLELPELLDKLLEMVMHACDTENGSLILIDDASRELEFVAVIGGSHDHLLNHRMAIDAGVVGYVVKTREPVLVENVQKSRKWSSSIDERLDFHTQSLMCVPLTTNDQVIGAIEVVNQDRDAAFDENDLNVLHVAGRLVSQVLECVEEMALKSGDSHDAK